MPPDNTLAQDAARSRSSAARFVIGLLFALTIAAVGLVVTVKRVLPDYTEAAGKALDDPEYVESQARSDPRLGTVLSLDGVRDRDGRPVVVDARGRYTVVLFIAGPKLAKCSACRTGDFIEKFYAMTRAHPELVTYLVWVGQTDLKGQRFNARKMLDRFHVVVDPKLRVAKAYNAFFQPRAYLLTKNGKLAYSSFHGMESGDAIAAIEPRLKVDTNPRKDHADARSS